MHKQKIGFLSFLIVVGLSAAMVFYFIKNPDSNKNNAFSLDIFDIIEVKQEDILQKSEFNGVILPKYSESVSMNVSGKIEANHRSLNAKSTFKKGEILIKLDRVEALLKVLESRSDFKSLILNSIPEIIDSIPSESEKWQTYAQEISRTDYIQELPKYSSEQENEIISKLGIESKYYETRSYENNAEKYFFIASYNGVILSSSVQPGSTIIKNKNIMQIAPSTDLIVEAHISSENINRLKNQETIYYYSSEGDIIGEGKLLEIIELSSEQAFSKCRFSINTNDINLINQNIKIKIDETDLAKSMAIIPKSSLIDSNHVLLLENGNLLQLKVTVKDEVGEYVYVEGLPDRCYVITNPIVQK